MQMSSKSYYEIALNDYRFLATIRDGDFYNKIGIECQQIAEKFLKYLYVTYIDVCLLYNKNTESCRLKFPIVA